VIANGQFIMVAREGYEAAGTHQGVRDQVAEDLALAQNFFRAKRRIHFAFANELMETRMYLDLPHLVEGWSKNLYLGSRQSYPDEPLRRAAVPLSLLAGVGFLLAPPAALLTSLLGLTPSLLVPAAVATGLSVLFWMLFASEMEIPPLYGIGYPLGGLALGYIVVRSIWRGGRRVEWKGRVYGGSGER